MIVKILGVLDLIAGTFILFNLSQTLPIKIILILGIIIALKSSLGQLKNIASWIDLCAGIFILLGILIYFPFFLRIIVSVLILQKGIISLI